MPYKEKTQIRGVLMTHDEMPIRHVGRVTFIQETYGFVQCDSMNLRAFFSKTDGASESVEHISVDTTVTFELGFTLRGPTAIRMAL